MKKLLVLILFLVGTTTFGQKPVFKVIAFYTSTVERDHVQFAYDAIAFFEDLAIQEKFQFDTTTDWANLNNAYLAKYQVIMWIKEFPHTEEERRAFENFMEQGGAWLGFHVSAYNDKDTHWPWFVNFLGGAVFHNNSWPPLRAKLIVDDRNHPVTRHLPASYISPINEWYQWVPNPRLNKDVRVLVTLDPENYPLGKKDILRSGDIPVVWTNTKYRMLYMNMGHGDKVLSDSLQNKMFADGILWLGGRN
jgi:uncharacterized protein